MFNHRTLISAAVIIAVGAGAALAAGKHGHRDLTRMFDRLDVNADGEVDREEFAAAREMRFDRADADNDGLVTEAEMAAALRARADDRAARMASRAVSRLDSDDDGAISKAEYMAHSDRAERMFDRVDDNDDGVISKAEAEAAQARFASRRK